jgi:hypothetical protein
VDELYILFINNDDDAPASRKLDPIGYDLFPYPFGFVTYNRHIFRRSVVSLSNPKANLSMRFCHRFSRYQYIKSL